MPSIREVILANIEPTEPQDTILAWLKANADGQRITERHIEKLRKVTGNNSIRLRKNFGMTHIEWDRDKGSPGSLLLAHKTVNVVIDADEIREKNPAYFSALAERNTVRQQTLQDEKAIAELERQIGIFKEARDYIRQATEYGAPFNHDRFAIEEAFGIKEK